MCCNCCAGGNFLRSWRRWVRPLVIILYVILLLVVLPLLIIRLQQRGARPHDQAWFIGGLFVLMTLPITIWEITQHLVHYTKPILQKHIIRILWMVPIYALNAWLGLLFPEYAIYLDTCRECYEAYVIYNFMQFLLNFLQTETEDYEAVLEAKPPIKHIFPLCCLPPWKRGKNLINRCRHGTLQYTIVRPILTIVALICELTGYYHEGEFKAKYAFPYLLIMNNFSQFIAMYSLILFYRANKEELAPMQPILKFLCIKAVVFFSFFQSVIITILVDTGVISESFTTKDDKVVKAVASSLQDFLICIEMFLAAVAHLYAFSYKPYVDAEIEQMPCWESFRAMWDVSDVRRDVSDHIRVVGSTVHRSVRRRPPNTGPVDERTRLLQPEPPETSTGNHATLPAPPKTLLVRTMEEEEEASPRSPHPSRGVASSTNNLLTCDDVSQDDDDHMVRANADAPLEQSLIDFSANV